MIMSGSLTIMMMVIILFNVFKIAINKVFVRLLTYFPKSKIVMDIGLWGFQIEYLETFKYANQKLFLESYMDIILFSLVNLSAFALNHWEEFGEYWSGFGNVVCSMFTVVSLLLIIVFPIFGFVVIHKNRKNLDDEDVLEKH